MIRCLRCYPHDRVTSYGQAFVFSFVLVVLALVVGLIVMHEPQPEPSEVEWHSPPGPFVKIPYVWNAHHVPDGVLFSVSQEMLQETRGIMIVHSGSETLVYTCERQDIVEAENRR